MHRAFRHLAIAFLWAASGCYQAEFDEFLDRVYVCESADDCAEGFDCHDGVCRDNRGPSLAVQHPEPLQIYRVSDTRDPLSVTLRGTGLTLKPRGGEHVDGEGHVEIRIDGEPVALIESGFVEASVAIGDLEWPDYVGLHRIQAIARQNDGQMYSNPGAIASSAFWLDNGTPVVGLISPTPGQPIANGEQVRVEVQALNFDFLEPGDHDDRGENQSGHAHLFFNMDIPACLSNEPSCNGGYIARLWPASGERSDRVSWTGALAVRSAPGTPPVSVVLETHGHQPFPSSDPDEVAYDNVLVRVVGD